MAAPASAPSRDRRPGSTVRAAAAAALLWALTALALAALDGRVEHATLALLLVLAAALSGLLLPPGPSVAVCTLAVAAFNWSLVPPRGSLRVALQPDALLLATTVLVGGLVAALVARQRRAAERAAAQAARAEARRAWAEALRGAGHPRELALPLLDRLRASLHDQPGVRSASLWLPAEGPRSEAWIGDPPSAGQREGAALAHRLGRAFGPGTGRHEAAEAWILPLTGPQGPEGVLVLGLARAERGPADPAWAEGLAALPELLEPYAAALAQARLREAAAAARAEAEATTLRNTLLAAIAHDQRTPLAALLGAATALREDARPPDPAAARRGPARGPDPARRAALLDTVIEEAEGLVRLSENSLQLARLEAPGARLAADWESVEEIVATVLARARRRDPGRRLKARVEPGLPLLQADAARLVQLLDNLVDNALRHGGPAGPVELLARRQDGGLLLAVRDRGPGVPRALRERIFQPFERGPRAPGEAAPQRRGAGLGLALGRAIANAHGGQLRLRARAHGGASFECWLPLAADAPAPGQVPPAPGPAPAGPGTVAPGPAVPPPLSAGPSAPPTPRPPWPAVAPADRATPPAEPPSRPPPAVEPPGPPPPAAHPSGPPWPAAPPPSLPMPAAQPFGPPWPAAESPDPPPPGPLRPALAGPAAAPPSLATPP